jgi:hypothetical protein
MSSACVAADVPAKRSAWWATGSETNDGLFLEGYEAFRERVRRERALITPERLPPKKIHQRAFWLKTKDSAGMHQIQKALRGR